MLLVGFSGYAQTGKTSCANLLQSQYGFIQVGFADKLREFLEEMNPVVKVYGDGRYLRYLDILRLLGYEVGKQQVPGFRKVLKDAGMAARNTFGGEFWISELAKDLEPDADYVFQDVRFLNEAAFVQVNRGIVIRINRPSVGPDSDHPSETEMDQITPDYILENNATLSVLRHNLMQIMNNHIGSVNA